MYTRTGDTYPDINERAKKANEAKVDYFVSIHLNSGIPAASGIETLIYGKGGQAEQMAKLVQTQLVLDTGAADRGVKIRPDLGVLRLTNMPAILVETGFLSNGTELSKFQTEAYRQKIAKGIGKGICQHLGISGKEKMELVTLNDIVYRLYAAGILTDKAYWMEKGENDQNVYWLMRKMANYTLKK